MSSWAEIVGDLPEVVWAAERDPAGRLRVAYVSPAVLRLGGVSPDDLVQGRVAWLDLVDRADRRRVRGQLVAALRGEAGALEHRVRGGSGGSALRWVRSSFTPRVADGRVTGLVGVTADLGTTLRAHHGPSQGQSLRSLATLAGGVAHDMNNLMVAVLGHVALLREGIDPHHPQAWRMEQIFRCVEDAGQLADQLLAYARGGKHQVTRTALHELVRGAVHLLSQREPQAASMLDVDLEPDLPSVEGDPKQLLQVVLALLQNAAEAAPHQGRLRASARAVLLDAAFCRSLPGLVPGRYALLEVQDRGCGMTSETLARCFEPFFSTKERGRGMGLAAANGIVTNHGGHMAMESAPGHGTTVRVYLPLASAGAPGDTTHFDLHALAALVDETPADPVVTPAQRRDRTVLLVDDEPLIVEVLTEHLQAAGYRTLTASDGRAAVALAETPGAPIDLIVLDLSMPGMDGTAAYPLLRAARPAAKVLVCSGYDLDTRVQRLLDKGADRFLQKPFRADVLVQTIDELLL